MRKFTKPLGWIMTGLTIALLGTPTAQADNASFITEARAIGFKQAGDDVLIRMGLSTCRFLQPQLRRYPSDVVEHIRRQAAVELDQANQFLVLSVNEYCPQLAYRIGT